VTHAHHRTHRELHGIGRSAMLLRYGGGGRAVAGATELFTWPSEAIRRLDLLTDRWNVLRAAAWGRGTTPLVEQPLADEVESERQAFSDWREKIGGMEWIPGLLDELNDWTTRANRIADKLRAAKKFVPGNLTVYTGPVEAMGKSASEALAHTDFAGLIIALAGIAAAAYVLPKVLANIGKGAGGAPAAISEVA
jgi:hypothetical protein